jgi:hypothetical protein
MMLKIGSEYLDFNGGVELEKKNKLFEDIASVDGDVSFEFFVDDNSHNARLLSYPVPDSISKVVYHRINAELQDDSGVTLHSGFIRIERRVSRETLALSFFSGNSNWFGLISGHLSELDFSAYDVDQTQANIISSWSQTSGIVFPFLDNGGLVTRSAPEVKVEDFVGGFYVHTIFRKIFTSAGIKLQGELLDDWRYRNLVCISTSRDQSEIDARSMYAHKTENQVIALATLTDVTYDDDFTDPYFDGSNNSFNLATGEYTADVKMSLQIDSTLSYHTTGITLGLFAQRFLVNGVSVKSKVIGTTANVVNTNSYSTTLNLEAGDVLKVEVFEDNGEGDAGTVLGGSLKITPLYIYRTLGQSAVPNWTQQEFVSNIMRIFNVLPSFEPKQGILTLNLFEKLKIKEPIDISSYVSDVQTDYTDFISDYAKRSILSYNEVEFEDLKLYNKGKIFKYGQGSIEVDNDFLGAEADILESDFSNPVDYVNAVFDASIGKTNLIELEEGEEVTFDDVADNGAGLAAFHISNEIFQVGDLVRIYDSTNVSYNGDYIVDQIPTGHVVFNTLAFDTAADGKIVKLNYKYSSDENVFLFINIPNYTVTKFAGGPIVWDDDTTIPSTALAYFDMINTGREVNLEFIYSLSFGGVEDPLRYMVDMVDSYFHLFSRVLNDPVKLNCTCAMPANVYRSIDFLRPLMVKTLETSNIYYGNKMSGYQSSYENFLFELVKLP